MQTIYLDISNKGVVPTVYAKQGDVGRKFEVVFTNSGLPYNPPDSSVFSVWYSGKSGEGNYTDIGDRSAFSINGNKVAVELITQMLTNDGTGVLCLVLNEANGNQIGSWNIPYICEGVPGFDSEEAKGYFTAFSKAVKELPYPDPSLSVAGKSADAAATGEALAGKAPAGYGLGGIAKEINWADIDSITANGWYRVVGSVTISGETFMNPYIRVDAWDSNTLTQTVCCQHMPRKEVKRARSGGTWLSWEWVNPPMIPGVEYRTTKRYNGEPVYTQTLVLACPAHGASASIDFGTGRAITALRGVIDNAHPSETPSINGDTGAVTLFAFYNKADGKIYIQSTSGHISGGTCRIFVEYTKN